MSSTSMRVICLPLLFCLCWQSATAGSVFRFGAVLSSGGRTRNIADAKKGYELYFQSVNALSNQSGFLVQGKPGTPGFHFKYKFIWRDDSSDRATHRKEVKKLLKKDRVHFLGGSHPSYAEDEMRMANESNVLCYHCCVAPDTFYERDYRTTFGIAASNAAYTEMFMRRLALENVSAISIIYDKNDEFYRTTCEGAQAFAHELRNVQDFRNMFSIPFDVEHATPDNATSFAEELKKAKMEVLFLCAGQENERLVLNALNEAEYSLKALFMAVGPTRQNWINSFEPPELADYLLSAVQWHPDMKYPDDFFGSTREYTRLYQEMYGGLVPDDAAAAASAVGLTLTQAIQDAFAVCNISKTEGDVDSLLFDPDAIECDDDYNERGYDRVLRALAGLKMNTFFGRVHFNHFRRNTGLIPVTTQVFERRFEGSARRVIKPVLPFGFATALLKFPAKNRFKENCPSGFYVGPDTFDPCVPCNAGESSRRTNSKHCDACAVGEWTNLTSQSECFKCPAGTVTVLTGAQRLTDCICQVGYFNRAGVRGVECEPCPDGAACNGGTNPPIANEGYWSNSDSRADLFACEPASICLGGEDSECAKGYTGRLCAECQNGYFNIIDTCYKCLQERIIITIIVLLLIGWYVINVIVAHSVASLDMILSWAQLANIVGDVNLNWTENLSTMFGIANILDFDVDILEPSCIFTWSFSHNFVVQLCLPFVMTLMGASGYLASMSIFYALERKWIRLEGQAREVVSLFVNVPEDKEELDRKWDTTLATFLASVDTTYVTITKYCFDCFKCRSIAGVSVLSASPDIECGSSEHTLLLLLASFGIVVYVIGYLGYVSWTLYRLYDSRSFSEEKNIRRFGFIYGKYELDYYYTPAIALIRKLLFVLVLVFMNNPAFQIGTLAIIINASLMIHVYTAPYVDTYLDVLFNFLLLALMFEAFGGLMFYSDNLPQSNRDFLEWIVLATLFLLVCVFCVIFALEVITKFQMHVLKKKHLAFVQKELGHGSGHFWFELKHLLKRNLSPQQLSRSSLETKGHRTPSLASSVGKEDKDISFELLDTFHPNFVYKAMKEHPALMKKWDRLTNMLKEYMSDQSETSYLSMEPAAKFWRKLVGRFPELVDFLAVTDDQTRQQFSAFATNLYRNFYLSKKVLPLPLMDILNWRDHAPMAHWLAIASKQDRAFFVDFVADMFSSVGDEESAEMLRSRYQNGGHDPDLESRSQKAKVSKGQQRILTKLSEGSNPFSHNAAKQFNATVNTAVGVNRFLNNIKLPACSESERKSSSGLEPSPFTSSTSALAPATSLRETSLHKEDGQHQADGSDSSCQPSLLGSNALNNEDTHKDCRSSTVDIV